MSLRSLAAAGSIGPHPVANFEDAVCVEATAGFADDLTGFALAQHVVERDARSQGRVAVRDGPLELRR